MWYVTTCHMSHFTSCPYMSYDTCHNVKFHISLYVSTCTKSHVSKPTSTSSSPQLCPCQTPPCCSPSPRQLFITHWAVTKAKLDHQKTIDGVGPVDNRPSTNLLHHFVHVTHDTWHMTRDRWHMTHNVGWTFSQNFRSLYLRVRDLQYLNLRMT